MRRFAFVVAAVAAAQVVVACSSSTSSSPGDGSGGDGGGGGGGAGGGGAGACTPVALSPATSVPKGATLVDLAVDAEAAWLLVRGSTDRSLTVVRPSGATKVLEAANVTSAALSSRSDGKVCAAWGVSKPTPGVRYACGPDFAAVDTKVTMEISADAPLAFRDEPTGGAMLFEGKYASLDGMARGGAEWRDADVSESSISFPGGVHALSGAEEGSPYCFIAAEGEGPAPVVVRSWMRSGSANAWGAIALDDKAEAKTCAVALAGSTLGVLATGGGKAKFATATREGDFASELAQEAFDAPEVSASDLAADKDGFTVVYATPKGAFRAVRSASAAGWQTTPLSVPGGASIVAVSVAKDANGEHVALQSADATYYQRSCR